MKQILETKLLEYEKSAFLVELVKHSGGKLYIEISQTISDEKDVTQSIKINPSILDDVLNVLIDFKSKMPVIKTDTHILSDARQQKIQDWYLKGVSIKDLAMQMNLKTELIEMVLRNRGIKIVSNEMPKNTRWRRTKKKG